MSRQTFQVINKFKHSDFQRPSQGDLISGIDPGVDAHGTYNRNLLQVIVDQSDKNPKKAAWFRTKLLSAPGGQGVVNNFYTVYWPLDGSDEAVQKDYVAAPCPPFCKEDSGAP